MKQNLVNIAEKAINPASEIQENRYSGCKTIVWAHDIAEGYVERRFDSTAKTNETMSSKNKPERRRENWQGTEEK